MSKSECQMVVAPRAVIDGALLPMIGVYLSEKYV
jgi:hypothetical protein